MTKLALQVRVLGVATLAVALGCAQSNSVGGGSGGSSAEGGSTGSGGSGSGGTSSSGGAIGSGGSSSGGRGGSTATGGVTGTGGNATGGTTGAGGSAGTRGTGGAGGRGTGGTEMAGRTGSGSGGTGGSVSTGGGGNSASCTFTATATQSTNIPTVFTVAWSTTLSSPTSAEIDFGPAASGPSMVAPVTVTGSSYKTVLVGMKPSTAYMYRIVAKSSAGTCTSQDYMITTGALSNAPKPTVSISAAASHDKGFIVASSGLNGTSAYIMDADGTVVWVAPSGVPNQPSRVHLSWDASKMYEMSLNVMNTSAGKIVLQPLDGSASTTMSGVQASHHDLTAIPGGFATPMWNKSGTDAPCSIVEFTESGAMTTVLADVGTVYTSSTFHTNAIHYYMRDNTYTIGDRNPNLYVKISRTGSLIWQFGGANPKDSSKMFSGVTTWQVNHGHHLTADGTFVFFNNNANEMWNYKLDESTMKATQVMHYTASGAASNVLGDAQVLPNGNILVTFSTGGQIHEITPVGNAGHEDHGAQRIGLRIQRIPRVAVRSASVLVSKRVAPAEILGEHGLARCRGGVRAGRFMPAPSTSPVGASCAVLVFRARDRACAMPIAAVDETMRPWRIDPMPRSHPAAVGVARVRGLPTPVVDVGLLLGSRLPPAFTRLVILRLRNRRAALAVESVLGIRWLHPGQLQPLPPLLQPDGDELVAELGALDEELLLLLQAGRLLPDELWTAPPEQRP